MAEVDVAINCPSAIAKIITGIVVRKKKGEQSLSSYEILPYCMKQMHGERLQGGFERKPACLRNNNTRGDVMVRGGSGGSGEPAEGFPIYTSHLKPVKKKPGNHHPHVTRLR